MSSGQRQWFRLLKPFLRPALWPMVGGFVTGLFYAALSGAGMPVMMKTVMPIFFGEEQDASPYVVSTAKLLFGDDYVGKLLLVACLGMPLIMLLRGVCAVFNRYLVNLAGFLFLDELRRAVFARLQDLPLAFYQRHKTGDLASRLVNDAAQLRLLVTSLSTDLVTQPCLLVFAVGCIIYLSITNQSALFTLIALTSVPICVIPIQTVTRRVLRRSRAVAHQSGELAAEITESIQSPLEIQAYNLQAPQRERFAERLRSILRLSMKAVKYSSFLSPTIEFVAATGFMVGLYFGVQKGIDIGTFSALGLALYMAYEPVKRIGAIQTAIKSTQGSYERLEEILTAEDTLPNPAAPRTVPPGHPEIAFENVSFRYDGQAEEAMPALREANVVLRPGDTVALVGPSGAGKSTFSLLIPRFFDPTQGRVTYGGIDLRELDKAALRDRIAIVPQSPVLFNASVADNIRMGRPDAPDEAVQEAARKAFVHDFVVSLPDGYNTLVGERGASLSGGQRQRVAIARAFLKDAPVLVLDEATSALDAESEAMVQEALRKLVEGRTTVMIAHRFSSISMARRVLVFDQGRITGDGSPDHLARTHPIYQRMHQLQQLA
ncbi:MAG: ABC transporter ATP-binding protein [Verrucomicrobiales bacterium]|nr:ABC transporter ATP-binding protein [Verrucomicrobiales bacterium]